jgi:hypothetical protein
VPGRRSCASWIRLYKSNFPFYDLTINWYPFTLPSQIWNHCIRGGRIINCQLLNDMKALREGGSWGEGLKAISWLQVKGLLNLPTNTIETHWPCDMTWHVCNGRRPDSIIDGIFKCRVVNMSTIMFAIEFAGRSNFTVREISVQRFEIYLDIFRYLWNTIFSLRGKGCAWNLFAVWETVSVLATAHWKHLAATNTHNNRRNAGRGVFYAVRVG